MTSEVRSPAKRVLMDFIKTELEKEFQFELKNTDERAADQFVQHMRVELSRLRGLVKARGRSVKQFKMLLIKIEYNAIEKKSIVTLKKSNSRHAYANELLDEAFADVAGGKLLNG